MGAPTNQTGIVPRLPVQILANGIPIYTGLVTDWDINYDLGFNDTATVQCADQFTVLSNQQINAVTPSTEKTGARIDTVLNYSEINYHGARSIDAGLTEQ